MDSDKYETKTFSESDMVWIMAWDSDSQKKQQMKFSPEALQDEEIREDLSSAILKMLKDMAEGEE